jgi:predicted amidohydrolase
MRALLAALQCNKSGPGENLSSHLRLLGEAAATGCDLALFPEMSLTGSVDPARNPERLVSLDHKAVSQLVRTSGETGVGICFGVAERSVDDRAHITQVFAAGGNIIGVQRKRHLGDGEESFTPVQVSTPIEFAGITLGMAICAESGFDSPFDSAAAAGAQLVLFPAAPGLYGRRTDEDSWRSGFSWWEGKGLGEAARHARRLGIWIALATQAGSTVDEDFPGLAALVSPDGTVVDRLPDWGEGALIVDIPL